MTTIAYADETLRDAFVQWSVETGEKQATLKAGEKFVMSVACSPDGKSVACGAEDGTVTVFNVETGQPSARLTGHALTVRTLAFTKDSAHLFTGSDDGRCCMYDVAAGSQVRTQPLRCLT